MEPSATYGKLGSENPSSYGSATPDIQKVTH
jgi:hypothetical protein